ncbi:hypothetical protein KC19_4G268400 [Ceratodon purpureus]|uniref:RAP domain-containing protein n=1 Tax=Ceratodon purpureus TaxID=3225 RepID=A0A8T0IF59_CERPU|nr:hypothetical protein KC19_4G268400 [Ceratodon purpureus]
MAMALTGCSGLQRRTPASTTPHPAVLGPETSLRLNFNSARPWPGTGLGGFQEMEMPRLWAAGGGRAPTTLLLNLQRGWNVVDLRAALDFRISLKSNVGLSRRYNPLFKYVQPRPQTCSHVLTMADLLNHIETSLQNAGQDEGTTARDISTERVNNAGATSKERVSTGPGLYREERSLNRRIIEAPDAEYVLAVVTEALNKPHWGQPRKVPLSPVNCATALHRIAKRLDEASMRKSEKLMFARRPEMRDFLDASVKAFPWCSGQGLANIAWALSKIGGSALFIEEMDLLADAAHEKLPEFNAQNLANTTGAFASMLHSAPFLFEAVAKRAGTLTDTFRPQELVQILWAFACMNHPIDFLFDSLDALMVEKPDAQATTFRGFSQQQLASMAWSSAVLGQMDRPWFISLWKCINARSMAWTSELDRKPKGAQHLCQLYQANLALRLECPDSLLVTERELDAMIHEAWEKEKAASKLSSGDHKEVDRLLVGATGRSWVSEYEGAPYSLDLALVDLKVALEIDGRTHFSRNTNTLLGHTVLKQRLLRAAEWTIIPIPFHEWEELRGELERTRYLRRLLDGFI